MIGLLLEREVELTAIEALLGRAKSGAGGLLVVEGAAGLGKSRLLVEAALHVEGDGGRVLRARGEELDRAVPWGLARRLLGPAVARAETEGAPLLVDVSGSDAAHAARARGWGS